MEDGYSTGGKATFNQAFFSQQRLHELFSRIDKFSCAPLDENIFSRGTYNYEIIIRDLFSIAYSISSKFDKKEIQERNEYIDKINTLMSTNPPKIMKTDWIGKRRKCTNISAWLELNKLLVEFRDFLNRGMEKYDLGNPNKDDGDGYD